MIRMNVIYERVKLYRFVYARGIGFIRKKKKKILNKVFSRFFQSLTVKN